MKTSIPIICFILSFIWGCLSSPVPAPGDDGLVDLVTLTTPAVVTVIAYDDGDNPKMLGSGFFINSSGHVITNLHVVEGMRRMEIKTARNKVYPVLSILSRNKDFDLVKLAPKMDKKPAVFLDIETNVPRVGEDVVVIGSPLGLERTVSRGIVSALRKMPLTPGGEKKGLVYQINAPVSGGSSGGPVLNARGRVIGVASFQMTGGQNLNFAVPSVHIAEMGGDIPEILPQKAGKLKHYTNEKGSIVITR